MTSRENRSILPLMLLVGAYYFLQGMGGNPGLHDQALELYLKNTLSLDSAGQATFLFFVSIPWMIKPLYGILSDSIPIFGYRRTSYFILGSVLSLGAYILISLFGYSYEKLLLLYTLGAVGFAFSDVLCDAVMVEKGQPLNATDRLQSAQWAAISCAGIILAFSGGYLAHYFSLQEAILLSSVFPCLVIVVTLGFFKEEKSSSVRLSAKNAWEGIKKAATMRAIWGCALFIFFYKLSPNLGTPLYNYQIDVLGFTQIDIGHLRTVGRVGFLLGTLLFAGICKKISDRTLLHSIIGVGVLTTLAYLFYKDFTSAFAIDFFTSIVGVVTLLGILILAAKVCPRGAEGTVFAALMSIYNLGGNIGNIVGGSLYDSIGYDWLVLISAGVTALMWFFLPLVQSKPIHRSLFLISLAVGLVMSIGFAVYQIL